MSKRKIIFICIFSFSLLINLIPLLIFKDKAVLSLDSIYLIVCMVLVVARGVASYFFRHKGNFLMWQRGHNILFYTFFMEEKDSTFTEKYEKKFFWMFCIYWFFVPCYIPFIFFISSPEQLFYVIVLLFAPQVIICAWEIAITLKEAKEFRALEEKQQQEKREQERREEMGHIK